MASLSSDTTMSPSPPLGTIAPSGHLKPQGIRARRLRLSQATSEHLPDCSGVRCFPGTGTTARVTDRVLQRVEQVTTTNVPLLSQAAHIPRPPPTHSDGLMGSRYGIIKYYVLILIKTTRQNANICQLFWTCILLKLVQRLRNQIFEKYVSFELKINVLK